MVFIEHISRERATDEGGEKIFDCSLRGTKKEELRGGGKINHDSNSKTTAPSPYWSVNKYQPQISEYRFSIKFVRYCVWGHIFVSIWNTWKRNTGVLNSNSTAYFQGFTKISWWTIPLISEPWPITISGSDTKMSSQTCPSWSICKYFESLYFPLDIHPIPGAHRIVGSVRYVGIMKLYGKPWTSI